MNMIFGGVKWIDCTLKYNRHNNHNNTHSIKTQLLLQMALSWVCNNHSSKTQFAWKNCSILRDHNTKQSKNLYNVFQHKCYNLTNNSSRMSFLLSKRYNPNVESNKTRIAMTMYLCWRCFAFSWASVSSDLTTILGSSCVKMEDLLLWSVGLSGSNSLITWIGVPTSSIRIIEWSHHLYEANTNMITIGTSRL